MKIRDTRSVGSVAAPQARPPIKNEAESAPPPRRVEDSVSILGIPGTEMTPKVQQAIMTLMREVDSLRGELNLARRRLEELEKLADQDALIPMPNRRAFVRELSRMLSFSDRYGGDNSIIYFDVNGLKRINDTYGHNAGDALLAHVATVLSENVRESDMVARLGGDEFGVLLVRAEEDKARAKASSLAKALEDNPLEWNGEKIFTSAAFGVYSFKPGTDVQSALAAADQAMYEQKRGRPDHGTDRETSRKTDRAN